MYYYEPSEELDVVINYKLHGRQDMTTHYDAAFNANVPSSVLATSISLDISTLDLILGNEIVLTATVLPEDATDKTVTWTSSDKSVVTVSENGLVQAKSVGTATITATCGTVSAICTVTVTPNAYTIAYLVDGEVYYTETVKIGAAITPIAEPEKEGHTFSGWSEIPETMPAHDVTVTGSFSVNFYTITYVVDNENYKTETYQYGETITPIAEPTKEGYSFSGWSEIPETMPAHDVTITGTFIVNTYNITYIVDGEVCQTDTYEYGAVITQIAEPEKEGHTFSGWSEIPETMPAHDVTVTGTFTVNKYMVRYYDGETLLAEFEVEYGATIPQYEYNNEEYIFEGWEGETYETMPAHDIAFYAITMPNGIADIRIDDDAEITVYDLTGLAVYKGKKAGLPKHLQGLYVVKYGDKTVKCRL